jgi:hypothetical protein
MFDSLPQHIGKDLFGGIQIAGLQRLNACGDLCFKRRRQVLLCKRSGSDPEKQQENYSDEASNG